MNTGGLFGSATLEVAIGLVFVYLLLAIICTTVNEWIAAIFETRSNTLANAIKALLDDQRGADSPATTWFLTQFYANPLIDGLKNPCKPGAHPAYIPARVFATAVIDVATQQTGGSTTFCDLENGIRNLPDGDVRKALLSLLQNAQGNLALAQKNIEEWFNDSMDRASGWYKRKTQLWTVIVASVLTLASNADTMKMAKTLWIDPTVRAEIVEDAQRRQVSDHKNSREGLSELSLVVGWNKQDFDPLPQGRLQWFGWLLQHLLGWTLTIVAISLGAPFWFDLLNKFMRIRNAGQNPNEDSKS